MCNEHPLLEYLEDPVAEADVIGNQKIIKRFREQVQRVRIGINKWFKSDIEVIRKFTAIITKDDDDDEEEKKVEEKKEEVI